MRLIQQKSHLKAYADAQRAVADAQRVVADAQRAVADAQGEIADARRAFRTFLVANPDVSLVPARYKEVDEQFLGGARQDLEKSRQALEKSENALLLLQSPVFQIVAPSTTSNSPVGILESNETCIWLGKTDSVFAEEDVNLKSEKTLLRSELSTDIIDRLQRKKRSLSEKSSDDRENINGSTCKSSFI